MFLSFEQVWLCQVVTKMFGNKLHEEYSVLFKNFKQKWFFGVGNEKKKSA